MKFCSLTLIISMIFLAQAPSAFATKADYCSAYAHDFANGQTQDKVLWQHKYEIAMADCLGESSTADQAINTKTRNDVKTKKIEEKIASVASKIVKRSQPVRNITADQTKLQPGSEAWNNYCINKYASFNAKTGTYTSKTGVARKCVVFYP